MNGWTVRFVMERLGLGLVLVSFVVLLTFVFSFLGTLCCAVLLGLMLGAARQWSWPAILISLVFPGVILTVTQLSNALAWRQSIHLSLVCFAGFWGMYALALGLVMFERKKTPLEKFPTVEETTVATRTAGPAQLPPVAPQAAGELTLEAIQGRWSCEQAVLNGEPRRKFLQFVNDEAAVSVVDDDGRMRHIARGGVRLERSGSVSMLHWLELEPGAPANHAEPTPVAATWICRMDGPRLTIASNFDSADPGATPKIETFRRA